MTAGLMVGNAFITEMAGHTFWPHDCWVQFTYIVVQPKLPVFVFCPPDLLTDDSGGFVIATTTLPPCVTYIRSANMCFTHVGALTLGVEIFILFF